MTADWYSLALGPEIVVLATAISAALAVCLAWLLHNRQFPGKRTINFAAGAALALPAPLLCYYLLAELGHVWPLNRLGLTLAGMASALPFLLRASRSSFASLSPAFGQAARSQGVSEWRVFSQVELPLVWRPLLAAGGLTLARVLLELTAAFWIAEPRA